MPENLGEAPLRTNEGSWLKRCYVGEVRERRDRFRARGGQGRELQLSISLLLGGVGELPGGTWTDRRELVVGETRRA